MKTYFFEATNGFNWGKFAVGYFDDEEWERRSVLPAAHDGHLLSSLGWGRDFRYLHMWVLDLQTGEGMYVPVDGSADYQLNGKHQIWVCPLFEPFLHWLYEQDPARLPELAGSLVRLTEEEAPSSLSGYRRQRHAAGRDCLCDRRCSPCKDGNHGLCHLGPCQG